MMAQQGLYSQTHHKTGRFVLYAVTNRPCHGASTGTRYILTLHPASRGRATTRPRRGAAGHPNTQNKHTRVSVDH